MNVGWQFVLAGIGTYLIRASAIALVGQGMAIPTRVERTLRLIAPAVLAAIIANGLILDHGQFNLRVSWYAGTLVAVFVVLLVPSLIDRPGIVAAMVGALMTVATAWVPHGLNTVIGAAAGVLVAAAVDRRGRR